MGALSFLVRMFRDAPSKRRLVRSLALGNKHGDRTVVSADGTRLAARRSGDGTPVVVVHGTLDGIGAFSLIELELAERYAVWVYDRRGRGDSGDGEEYSLEREVDDLRAVLAEAGPLPHVLAHSFGAVIALQARLAGVAMRSLTVYEPPSNREAVDAARVAEIRRAVDEQRPDDAIRSMARGLAGLSEDELGTAMSIPPIRKRLRDGVRTAPRELDVIRSCDWSGLPVDGVPTLVVRGGLETSDAYPTADQAAGLAVGAEVATIAGQGHLAHVFTPWEFATVVREFLDRN